MNVYRTASDLPAGPELTAAETTFQWFARPYAFLDACHEQFGDTFTLHFNRFGTHVVLADPDDVRAVFTGDRNVLFAGRGNALLEPILGRHSLLLADGDSHLEDRMFLQPSFRSERLSTYASVIASATRRWTQPWSESRVIRAQQAMLEISKEAILAVVLGDLTQNEIALFRRLIHDLMMLVGTNASFDAAEPDSKLLCRFQAVRGALDHALQAKIDQRRRSADGADDVLQTLVAATTTDGQPLSDDKIRDQLITMILAGHETTASSITWALYCLYDAPEVRQRLRQEIAGVADEGLAEVRYLQAVCLETLRLRPVIPVVSRQLQQPFRLGQYWLPAGIFVTPCAYLAHRRTQSFDQPEDFRPERFLERRFSPYAYFPFGGGVHRCLGMSFALLEMQIVVGIISRQFELEPAAPVRPVRRAVTIVASGGGKMHVQPLSN